MKVAMFVWNAGKYERFDEHEFDNHEAVLKFYKLQMRKWAAAGTQFRVKKVG